MSNQEDSRELELIAAAVHELKTPLTIVHGMSAMLQSQSHGELNEQQQEQVEQIRRAGNRMNALVESLLHVENLPYTQHIRPVQLHSELQAVLEEVESTAQQRNVTVAWQPRQTLPPVLADSVSAYQLLTHAITAVVKQAPAESEVTVRTRRRGSMVVVRIDTHGEPITPGEVKHIDRTVGKQLQPVRGQGGSAGLSWYIVKSIVEFYDGALVVSPQESCTTISIRLPMSNQLSLFA